MPDSLSREVSDYRLRPNIELLPKYAITERLNFNRLGVPGVAGSDETPNNPNASFAAADEPGGWVRPFSSA